MPKSQLSWVLSLHPPSYIVESEGRKMKQCWINYWDKKINPPFKSFRIWFWIRLFNLSNYLEIISKILFKWVSTEYWRSKIANVFLRNYRYIIPGDQLRYLPYSYIFQNCLVYSDKSIVSDPHWFNAGPDPAFLLIAVPDQFRIQGFDNQKCKKITPVTFSNFCG